jgi:hypothetical protein
VEAWVAVRRVEYWALEEVAISHSYRFASFDVVEVEPVSLDANAAAW